jgi:hypothetical protein
MHCLEIGMVVQPTNILLQATHSGTWSQSLIFENMHQIILDL